MSLGLGKYLRDVRKGAERFQLIDINGSEVKSLSKKWLPKFFTVAISLGVMLMLGDGFNNDFISFASTILSILIGLFITALIFSFDKFYRPLELSSEKNAWERLLNTQAFNYSKQFAYITGYNIILCVFTLMLLALSSLFPDASSVNIYSLQWQKTKIDFSSILLFVTAFVFIVQRFFILYWLLRIVYNTLFIVSSMVKFMVDKIDRQ